MTSSLTAHTLEDSMEATTFRTSSFCTDAHGCVEVAIGDVVRVRDAKAPAGGLLTFTRDEWTAFLHGAKSGEFDL